MAVKKGYKQTEVGVIPGDWEVRRLGEIAEITRGASPRPIENPIWFDEESMIGWVRISDVTSTVKFLNKTSQKLSDMGIKRSRFVSKNSLIMSICATVGRPILTKINVCIHDGFVVFSKLKIEIEYLYYFLSAIEKKWAKNGQTGSQMNLNTGLINSTIIWYPNGKTEQIAIANVLSDADALIQSLEKLIAKKRAIKQGTMQKLLKPREGWVVKRLGEVAEIKKGQLITEQCAVFGKIPVIAGGTKPSYYHNTANRKENTITVSASGANAGYVAFHTYKIYASDCSTIEESSSYNVNFIFFLLQSKQHEITKLQTGGAQPHVYPEQLKLVEVVLPPAEEQARIASILSDMDAEITALEAKLNKYKQIKLGMMQNLLTGRIRLI